MKAEKEFDQLIKKVCGLDVHQKEVGVTLMGTGNKTQRRTFSTYTSSLHRALFLCARHHEAIIQSGLA